MARTPLLNLRVEAATKERWEAAAAQHGLKLSEFIRLACDAAATRVLCGGERLPEPLLHHLDPGKRSYEPDFKKGGKA